MEFKKDHLSLENRFVGATIYPYSVGYHTLLGLHYVSDEAKPAFIIHDAPEAYTKDIPRPLKNWLRTQGITIIDELEDKIHKMILSKYKIEYNDEIKQEVKRVDNLLYLNERIQLQNWDFKIKDKDKLDIKIIPIEPLYIER
mgnify:FL=1